MLAVMSADFWIAGSQKRIVSDSKHNLRSCFSNNGLCSLTSLTITTTAVPLLSTTEVAANLLGTFRTKMIKTQRFTKFGRKHNEFLAVHMQPIKQNAPKIMKATAYYMCPAYGRHTVACTFTN